MARAWLLGVLGVLGVAVFGAGCTGASPAGAESADAAPADAGHGVADTDGGMVDAADGASRAVDAVASDAGPGDGQGGSDAADGGDAEQPPDSLGDADGAADAAALPDVPDPCDENLVDPTCCCGDGAWHNPICGPTGYYCPAGLEWREWDDCWAPECGWVEGTDTVDGGGQEDASHDASADTAGPDCQWFTDPALVKCGDTIVKAQLKHDLGNPACPQSWTLDGTTYDDFAALVAATGCDDCEYHATKAVDFITCQGPKSGYEVYEAAGCPVLYDTPAGPFVDLCDWPAQACYCD